jgi:hypothetical protein
MRAISGTSFKRATDRLEQHGDPALAFRIAELGLVRYLNCVALLSSRARALTTLRQINSRSIRFGSSSTPSGREKRSRPCRRNSRRIMPSQTTVASPPFMRRTTRRFDAGVGAGVTKRRMPRYVQVAVDSRRDPRAR